MGFLRGSGLNSADRKRRAGIRGVRTSRLLISRFEFESRSLASIPTVSEGQLRRNNRERDRAFVDGRSTGCTKEEGECRLEFGREWEAR